MQKYMVNSDEVQETITRVKKVTDLGLMATIGISLGAGIINSDAPLLILGGAGIMYGDKISNALASKSVHKYNEFRNRSLIRNGSTAD